MNEKKLARIYESAMRMPDAIANERAPGPKEFDMLSKRYQRDVEALVEEVYRLSAREKQLEKGIYTRLGTSQTSRDKDAFKRGYAQALEYVLSLIQVPPTPKSSEKPPESRED